MSNFDDDVLEVLRDVVGDCTPKPSGYWKIFANVRAALDLMITESGEFPSYTKIKNNNGSLAAAISKYHGGTNQVRKILGFGVIRKPNGYYSDQENIKRDLQQVIDKLGRFPSYPELNRLDGALLGGIEREHGGISTVREWYGETSPQKPDKYWKDPKHVMAALQPIIEKLGRFPLQTEIRETNQAIMGGISSHHGGLTEVRKWYNAERLEKPAGYWQDFDHVEEELGQIIDQLGRFPKQDELPSHLVNAIWRHHGGLTKVSKKCGFKYRKRPKKYWKDLDNVKAETDELIEKLGHFPNREELKNNNPALTSGLQKSHRGYTTLLEMYGKEEITTPRGYWEDFGNVKKELTPVINEIGKFPSYSELKDKNSRLLSAIEHRHGGISAVREKMGYLSKRKANGYWRSLEKVRTGLEPIVEELGKFPTAKEIQSRNNGLMHAIQRHHGGISAIKLRLGYANDELDILKQIVEDMQDEQL
ncbi:hypothetical protein HOK09_00195 [Candidatus Woesearchaeota archaeon]|mgnify:CR=1 FL=1|nr:hypothetical protein [Candidatus Woesearchaeota archaeon]